MSKIGRNDTCPCGSGKKYKKCCLASANASDFQFRWFRQVHAELVPKLIEFASDELKTPLIEAAWMEFDGEGTLGPYDPASSMNVLFLPWFLFNWTIELKPTKSHDLSDVTIAEMFMMTNEVNAGEEALLQGAIRCPYTLCEVIEVQPGSGFVLFDLLRRIQYGVVERAASQTLKRGEIIYCATSEIRGLRSNVGTGPYALRPTAKANVLELRNWILAETGVDKLTHEDLLDFESEIRGLYLDHVRAMLTPPRLANSDGDPLVPQKVYFDIDSANDGFHALKDLAKGEKKADLLREAVVQDGLIVKAEIPWLGGKEEARMRLSGSVLLGNLKLEGNTLVAEVNSYRRAERIKRLIERRMGTAARYKTTAIEAIEPRFQERWNAAVGFSESSNSATQVFEDAGISLEDKPELRAMLEETARQHWQSWFDLPVPALSGMTPREAAQTEAGRDLLESLLLEYERHEDVDRDNMFGPDVGALRRELGLD